VTRRLRVTWPDPEPFAERDGAPVRILAVSDQHEATLDDARNREALGPLDLVIGCGDLPSDYLNFLADAFGVHLVRILGNHDRPVVDEAGGILAPEPIRGRVVEAGPLPIFGLSWPGRPPRRDEGQAWRQVVRTVLLEALRRRPLIVASHIPPRGAGDVATDDYHIGSPAYRWLLDRLRPPLWLHGHTPLAGVREWIVTSGATTIVNVTGAVLVELVPPEAP
jgi:Icc-related predicted phosphoesterase